MRHWEAVVHLAGTGRALDKVLVGFVDPEFPAAVDADVTARTRPLTGFCCFSDFWFGHRHSPKRYYCFKVFSSILLAGIGSDSDSRIAPHDINRFVHNFSLMPKKVLALLGSPILDGNTARLLDEAIRGAKEAGCEVEKIDVAHMDILPCMEFFQCKVGDTCLIQDEMTEIFQKFREMDGLIIATPIMTMGIPGRLKSFMDRFQVFYMAKYHRKESFISPEHRKKRKMLFISIAGMNLPNVFDGARMTIQAFGEIIDCPLWDEVLQNDMDTIQDIATRPEVMEAAYRKGSELGRLVG